jgi:hypothetical protein
MDARLLWTSLLLAVSWFLSVNSSLAANYGMMPRVFGARGASVQSEHFQVTAPSPEFARQVCEAAEHYRQALAVEWLGSPLPPWQDACPIQVIVGPQLGAGGSTTFTFINGQPCRWSMEIQGSQERILDSVLPHEITHTILATHFGCALPRWADEGAATSVEHVSERTKQDQLLIQFLTSNRGIAFNQMFAMRDYPPDILPLYSQGYSLARYLIAQGGRQKYVSYVEDGMRWNNWTAATQKHYGPRSLSELQLSWLDWVRHGSPDIRTPARASASDNSALADNTPIDAREPAPPAPAPVESSVADNSATALVPLPGRRAPHPPATPVTSAGMTASGETYTVSAQDSWYAMERDRGGAATPAAATTDLRLPTPASPAASPAPERRPHTYLR